MDDVPGIAFRFATPYTLPDFLDTWASCRHSIRWVTGTHTSYRV